MNSCSKCGEDYPETLCAKCVTQSDSNGVVFEAVLTYCQCYLRNYNVTEVASAVERLFIEDEVVKARKLLIDTCSAIIPPTNATHELKYRRNTGARPAVQAYASDIAIALYKIASNEHCP